MPLRPMRWWVLAVSAAALCSGCGEDYDGGGDYAPSPDSSSTGTPPPSTTSEPAQPADGCPGEFPRTVPLTGTDVQTNLNLVGVTACTDGAGGMWLENKALIPWVVQHPAVSPPPPVTDDPQTQLFRESMASLGVADLIIEPGQAWRLTADPARLTLRVDSGASATWQLLTAAKSVADGRQQDGLAKIVSGTSPGREAVVACARAAWGAGKAVTEAGQQLTQTPSIYVLETIGLGQQVRDCGAALQRVEPTPSTRPLITAGGLAEQLRLPRTAALMDESLPWVARLCATVSRC